MTDHEDHITDGSPCWCNPRVEHVPPATPIEAALVKPLDTWSSMFLRRLADECERIITERNNDGVTS